MQIDAGRAPAAARWIRAARARLVAYVPQHSSLDAPLPVRDVVAQGRFAHEDSNPWARPSPAEQAAVPGAGPDRSGSAGRTDLHDAVLRGAAAGAAGAGSGHGAPVLLLDEPTAALDVGHALDLLAMLRQIAREGTAIVLVLHQLQEAAAVADWATLLAEGRTSNRGRRPR